MKKIIITESQARRVKKILKENGFGEYYLVAVNRGDEIDGIEMKNYDVITHEEKEEIERNNRYAQFRGPFSSEKEAYEAADSANDSQLNYIKHSMGDDDYGKGNNRIIDPLDRFELDSLDKNSDF